jgi:hypothetical protein
VCKTGGVGGWNWENGWENTEEDRKWRALSNRILNFHKPDKSSVRRRRRQGTNLCLSIYSVRGRLCVSSRLSLTLPKLPWPIGSRTEWDTKGWPKQYHNDLATSSTALQSIGCTISEYWNVFPDRNHFLLEQVMTKRIQVPVMHVKYHYIHTYIIHTYIHTYVHIHTYTYIHNTYIHTHTYTNAHDGRSESNVICCRLQSRNYRTYTDCNYTWIVRRRGIIMCLQGWRNVCVCVFFFLPYLAGMQSASAVLYCHLLSVSPHHIFPHYLINGTIFGQELLKIKHIVWFSLRLCQKHFLF